MDADDQGREFRAAMRRGVAMTAQLREHGSTRFDVTIRDLSVTGFRCETFYTLPQGARVSLTIPTLGALAALVAWKTGNMYGCRFEQPLHPAVLETIVERFPTG